MHVIVVFNFFVFCLATFFVHGNEIKIRTLYNSLDPNSVTQQSAFYTLHPNTQEGQKALKRVSELLGGEGNVDMFALSTASLQSIVDVVNKEPNQNNATLDSRQLQAIETLAQRLPNRKLKGYWAQTEEEVLELPPEEIDLARGLLLSQMGDESDAQNKRRSYEAMLDLMALQILSKLPRNASPKQKIRTINDYIFHEMRFRFPPHSLYAKDIDLYTFLPSVMDSHQGVCLGVSIMYLCLAQRLELPLEAITPPGHIYIRYREGDEVINIETTARGIHLDSDVYLGIDRKGLEQRNIKEVIGLAFMNQAALYSRTEDSLKALECYQKAKPFLPDDMLLKELMGYHYLFAGKTGEGKKLLHEVHGYISENEVCAGTMPEDFLTGKVDAEGINAIFMSVDETRESIIKKKEIMEKVLEKFPQFRDGWMNLATTWLQLHREKEALAALEKYWELHPYDPNGAYYLSVLHAQRMNYAGAWTYLHKAEALLQAVDHHPKVLAKYRRQLARLSPE